MDTHLVRPEITVFIAVYNGKKYLSEAINSILTQSYRDFELLIIDDGSTDGSSEIVSSFTDPRIRVIKNIENKGLVYTRNLGIEEAKGTYIAILDCDDVALPDRLQLQLDFMHHHPEIALCGGHASIIDSEGKVLPDSMKVVTGHQDMAFWLLFGNIFVNSSLMIKREVMKILGGYHPYPLAEDLDLSVRIADKYQVANIDHELVKYRIHESNVSKRAEEMEYYVKKVVANIHASLQIPFSERLVNIHYSLLTYNLGNQTSLDFLDLFSTLKKANAIQRKYPFDKLNPYLIQLWYDILFHKKDRNIARLFFNPGIFDLKYSTIRQVRRVLKQSFKNIIGFR